MYLTKGIERKRTKDTVEVTFELACTNYSGIAISGEKLLFLDIPFFLR